MKIYLPNTNQSNWEGELMKAIEGSLVILLRPDPQVLNEVMNSGVHHVLLDYKSQGFPSALGMGVAVSEGANYLSKHEKEYLGNYDSGIIIPNPSPTFDEMGAISIIWGKIQMNPNVLERVKLIEKVSKGELKPEEDTPLGAIYSISMEFEELGLEGRLLVMVQWLRDGGLSPEFLSRFD